MAIAIVLPAILVGIYVVPKVLLKGIQTLVKHKLKKILTKRTFKSDSTDICIICQEDYSEVKKCAELHCGHKYHKECIKKWMFEKPSCPLCNEGILMKNGKRIHI